MAIKSINKTHLFLFIYVFGTISANALYYDEIIGSTKIYHYKYPMYNNVNESKNNLDLFYHGHFDKQLYDGIKSGKFKNIETKDNLSTITRNARYRIEFINKDKNINDIFVGTNNKLYDIKSGKYIYYTEFSHEALERLSAAVPNICARPLSESSKPYITFFNIDCWINKEDIKLAKNHEFSPNKMSVFWFVQIVSAKPPDYGATLDELQNKFTYVTFDIYKNSPLFYQAITSKEFKETEFTDNTQEDMQTFKWDKNIYDDRLFLVKFYNSSGLVKEFVGTRKRIYTELYSKYLNYSDYPDNASKYIRLLHETLCYLIRRRDIENYVPLTREDGCNDNSIKEIYWHEDTHWEPTSTEYP